MPFTRRQIVPVVITASVVALVAVGLLTASALHLTANRSIGANLEEVNGQTLTTSYSSTSAAPTRDLPRWFPRSATNVTIEVPGPNSKGPGGIQVDADVNSSVTLPSSCQATGQSFPWVGWDDLNVPSASLVRCDGWVATIAHDHLYVWKS